MKPACLTRGLLQLIDEVVKTARIERDVVQLVDEVEVTRGQASGSGKTIATALS
jgi:hypothetical protein